MNPTESGGFVDLWWGWTALVIFAFVGSVVGSTILRKKQKQLDTA
jgi:ABC-type multidrug transport system permease subunit